MSIIYDALKKVERSIHPNPTLQIQKKEHKIKSKVYLLFVLVAGLGIFVANIVFGLYTKSLQSKNNVVVGNRPQVKLEQGLVSQPPQALPKEAPLAESSLSLSPIPADTENLTSPVLVLNGVFFSENEGYALINNQVVKKGDVIGGATVTQITLGGVELEFQGSVIKVSTSNQ